MTENGINYQEILYESIITIKYVYINQKEAQENIFLQRNILCQ